MISFQRRKLRQPDRVGVTQQAFSIILEGKTSEAATFMTLLQIPDDQAAALHAKAAAEGLTLEAWLQRLAGLEEPRSSRRHYNLADLVAQCDTASKLTEEDSAWLDAPSVGREAP